MRVKSKTLQRLWFVALDTVRRRAALHADLRAAAGSALEQASILTNTRIVDACVLPVGVRVVVDTESEDDVRMLVRRFVGVLGSLTRLQVSLWRQRADITRLHPCETASYRAYLQRCRSTLEEDTEQMKSSKNGKRSGWRAALKSLQAIERSNEGVLGTSEYHARLRRYLAAHDAPADDATAFSRLCAVIFAQGLSFEAIEKRRPAFDEAFYDFVPARVAEITSDEIGRMLKAPIIRNRVKIEACISNANRWVELRSASGSYLARVASIASDDDAASGWPKLTATLAQDFKRLGEPTARLALKRWGFFTALAHPGSRRVLQRLGHLKTEASGADAQLLLGSLAEATGKDPYSVEAAIAIFASAGPCVSDPRCQQCQLCQSCPVGKARMAAAT